MNAAHSHIATFISLAAADPRIRPVHISLFIALWHTWQSGGGAQPFGIARDGVMHLAKVSSRQTYLSAMIDLNNYGYIRYEPSFDPRVMSKVWLTVVI